jgi:predicted N-acetyltransferase YhbS
VTEVAPVEGIAMTKSTINIRPEKGSDLAAREALLDVAYGASRHIKSSARLRLGRQPVDGLAFVATERGRVVGTVRLWHVAAGRGRPALLLGPLAVHPDCRSRGIGAALTRHAAAEAQRLGHGAVLLVGDAPYYGRFGFSADKTGALRMPGPYERHRLLACELAPGALDGAHGIIHATGVKVPKPEPALPGAADNRARASRAA